jgi:NTE family protein
MANGHALVLGGGGVAGIAWITGLLAGLADVGQDVAGADVVIGTSAGANVAAQIGSGLSLRSCSPARSSRRCSRAS